MIIKLGFAIPNNIELLNTHAGRSLKAIDFEQLGHKFIVATAPGGSQGKNRNRCITNGKSCLEDQTSFDFDLIIFIDSDIEFSYEDIKKMIDSPFIITTGAYQYKNDAEKLHAGFWDKEDGVQGACLTTGNKGKIAVDWCGGGFLGIRKEALIKMKYPYFRPVYIRKKTKHGMLCEYTSTDYGFCINAKRNNVPIICDTEIKVKHIKDKFKND